MQEEGEKGETNTMEVPDGPAYSNYDSIQHGLPSIVSLYRSFNQGSDGKWSVKVKQLHEAESEQPPSNYANPFNQVLRGGKPIVDDVDEVGEVEPAKTSRQPSNYDKWDSAAYRNPFHQTTRGGKMLLSATDEDAAVLRRQSTQQRSHYDQWGKWGGQQGGETETTGGVSLVDHTSYPAYSFFEADAWDSAMLCDIHQVYSGPVDEPSSQTDAPALSRPASVAFVNDSPELHYDWNEAYQKLCETPISNQEDIAAKHERLVSLVNRFLKFAQNVCETLVTESGLRDSQKSIRPLDIGGLASGSKFRVGHCLFKFTKRDPAMQLYSCEMHSMKAAGNEITSMNAVVDCGLYHIHTTLTAVFFIRGFSIIATATVPIAGEDTLVLGSSDGGKTMHHDNDELKGMVSQIGSQLNLEDHRVIPGTYSIDNKFCPSGEPVTMSIAGICLIFPSL
jgi:hypothetical protein